MKNNTRKPTQEQIKAQKRYIELERQEMLGEHNKYLAYKALGRSPDDNEAAMHYIKNGGAEDFHKRYGHLLCLLPENEN